jgi:hypothetical protein
MKLKIDNDAIAEDFLEDILILGIVAPIKDYTFVWRINQVLGYSFSINNSIEIQLKKKKRDYFFSIYDYAIPGCDTVYYLYNNQHDGEFLLPEFKHLDFLWLAKGEQIDREELTLVQQTLRTIHGVQLVNELSPDKIKNKQHLMI